MRKIAHYVWQAAAAPVHFVQWVYRRGAYEPESAWRRTVDGQGATRSRMYQVGMQETYLSENKLRQAKDERRWKPQTGTVDIGCSLAGALVVLLSAVVGVRQREWTAIGDWQEAVVREMTRCLRLISEGRVPK